MVSPCSDVSTHACGAVLRQDGQKFFSRDYWPSESYGDVNLLESRALLNSLVSFQDWLSNVWVDVDVDNQVLKSALDNDDCKSSTINEVVKEVYCLSRDRNFSIQTFYYTCHQSLIPPTSLHGNIPTWTAHFPMVRGYTWNIFFGPHSFDLMFLDSTELSEG